MNVQSKYPTTPDEFLRWNEGREGKFDLVQGKIVDMMVRVSRAHAVLAINLAALLRAKLEFPPYTVSSADFGIKTGKSVRYPDVMVDGAFHSAADLAATTPLVIAEILSPSTMAIDLGEKVEEYKTVESLRHYIVLAQDEPRAWLWSRNADDTWNGPDILAGKAETIGLSGIGCTLPLADIYAGWADLKP